MSIFKKKPTKSQLLKSKATSLAKKGAAGLVLAKVAKPLMLGGAALGGIGYLVNRKRQQQLNEPPRQQ